MDYPAFLKNDKVRDRMGNIWTVLDQMGCQVFVQESCQIWFHPNKLTKVVAPQPHVDDFRTLKGRPGGRLC